MRAICCAVLAYYTWQVARAVANSGEKDDRELHHFISGIFILLSFALAAVSVGLCIAGL